MSLNGKNIVFKLVRKNRDGSYRSNIVNRRSKYCLRYEIGKKTVPKIGKIFVFESIEHAVNFANSGDDVGLSEKVLECECSDFSKQERRGRICVGEDALSMDETLDKFWDGTTVQGAIVPPGTLTVDWAKPIKDLKLSRVVTNRINYRGDSKHEFML